MPSVVLLLDLSAAFDTVDHEKLLKILYTDIGIRGKAYSWCKSFLTNRTFRVKIGEAYSDEETLLFGVAQGSVLGPRFFNIYTRPLYRYMEPTGFEIDGFADDNQLMKHFLPRLQCYALGKSIQDCLSHILQWMNEYFLRLNQDKTKILVIAPPSIRKEIIIGGVFLNNTCIRFVDSAKNLGFILDSELVFDQHVNKVVKACYMVIRQLSSIKSFLSTTNMNTLICTKVFSQLDYCNCLYFGISASSIKKLQRVQNAAARLVKYTPHSMLVDVFTKYHWLKVNERILFKLLLTVHKCLRGKAPQYVSSVLVTGAERTGKLLETKVNSRYGERAFSHAGPKVWNVLPLYIRSEVNTVKFKKLLKSFLITNELTFSQELNTQ